MEMWRKKMAEVHAAAEATLVHERDVLEQARMDVAFWTDRKAGLIASGVFSGHELWIKEIEENIRCAQFELDIAICQIGIAAHAVRSYSGEDPQMNAFYRRWYDR